MQAKVLNYRIIIEPDEYPDTGKKCFSAFCPRLGLVDYGETIEQALSRMRTLIKFHLECLRQEQEEIPADKIEEGLVTSLSFNLSPRKVAAL